MPKEHLTSSLIHRSNTSSPSRCCCQSRTSTNTTSPGSHPTHSWSRNSRRSTTRRPELKLLSLFNLLSLQFFSLVCHLLFNLGFSTKFPCRPDSGKAIKVSLSDTEENATEFSEPVRVASGHTHHVLFRRHDHWRERPKEEKISKP